MNEILVEKILVKIFLMPKINFFSTYINIMKKLPDYKRNYYLAHKKQLLGFFKDPRAISSINEILRFL